MRRFVPMLVLALAAASAQAQTAATNPTEPVSAGTTAPAAGASAVTMPSGGGHSSRSGHTSTRITWQQRFADANTTHDGHLTLAQAKAGDTALARHFLAIDQTKKGYITVEDVQAYRQMQRALHHQSAPSKPGAS